MQTIQSSEDGHHYFDCPKVWERIVTHPRFDEADVEALCAALNAKVRIVYPFTLPYNASGIGKSD